MENNIKLLQEEIAGKSELWGGDLFGVADLDACREEIQKEYGDVYDKYSRAISIGVYLPKDIINELIEGPTRVYLTYYETVNARLNDISLRVATLLNRKGYKAYPIPASQREGDDKLSSIFAHRIAAYEAGLGWIGKNCSIVTREFGPRVRFTTILTNAPLEAGHKCENLCPDNCHKCADACPVGAIKNVKFEEGQELSVRLDAKACTLYHREVRATFGKEICGKCLAACPFDK